VQAGFNIKWIREHLLNFSSSTNCFDLIWKAVFPYVWCLFGLFVFQIGNAQIVEKNDQGEQIIKFKDGSWRYFEPADSVYLQPKELQSLNRKIQDSNDHLEKLQVKLANIQSRQLNLQKAQKDNSYNREIIQVEIDSLNTSEQDLRLVIQSLEFELEEMLLRRSALQARDEKKQTPGRRDVDNSPPVQPDRELYSISHYSKEIPSPCEVQESLIPGTGGTRWSTQTDNWFHFTPKLLAHKYSNAPYLTGSGSILHDGNKYYLQLKIQIQDLNAPQSYGWVEKESPLFLLTMHSKTLEIRAQQEAIGQKDKQARTTSYTILYALPPQVFKTLLKEEISKLRLVWSSGYEDYDIFNIRFLQQHIECLQSNLN